MLIQQCREACADDAPDDELVGPYRKADLGWHHRGIPMELLPRPLH